MDWLLRVHGPRLRGLEASQKRSRSTVFGLGSAVIRYRKPCPIKTALRLLAACHRPCVNFEILVSADFGFTQFGDDLFDRMTVAGHEGLLSARP